MMRDQHVPALLAALLGEGVTTGQIAAAVTAVRHLPLGASIPALAAPVDAALVDAFINEQAQRLARA